MPKEPYLPFFFGDFLASTAYWRGEEQGLYLLLLGYQWSSGPLPIEPEDLAQIARYEPKHFQKLWKRVGTKFVRKGDGLINERLEAVRMRARQISQKNSDAGKQGAASRWQKNGERHPDATGEINGERYEIATGEITANATEAPMANVVTLGCGSNPIQSKVKSKRLATGEKSEWQ